MIQYNELYDKLRTREGWRFTEDVAVESAALIDLTLQPPYIAANVKLQIPYSQLNLFQQPASNAAYLVLRRLAIGNIWHGTPKINTGSFTAQTNQTQVVSASAVNEVHNFFFVAGPQPSGFSGFNTSTWLALKKIIISLDANLTVNKVEVRPHWSATYDNLFLNTGITGAATPVFLSDYYDGQYGLIDAITGDIDIRLTISNSAASMKNAQVLAYGTVQGQDSALVQIQYQDWNKGIHEIGYYDLVNNPQPAFVVDQLIPIPITDPGQLATIGGLGSLVYTVQSANPFIDNALNLLTTLTATIAYLLPYSYGQ